jgi:hypothetical protein
MLRKLFKLRSILIVGSSIAAYLPIVAGIIEPMIWSLLLASPLLYHLPKRALALVATASSASVAVIGIGLLVYFKKRKH